MAKRTASFQLPTEPSPAIAGSGPVPAAGKELLPDKAALAAEIKRLRSVRSSGCWFWRGNFTGIHRRRAAIQFHGVKYDVVRSCLYIAGKLDSPFVGGELIATCQNKNACFNPAHYTPFKA